jgi:hypothetical protein
LSTAAVEIEQDLMIHSNAEDNYILGPLQTTTRAPDPAEKTKDSTKDSTTKPPEPPNTAADEAFLDPKYDVIPTSTSPWKATEPLFRAAKNAPPNTPESYWSYTLYRNSTSTPEKKVTIHYCKSKHTSERVMQSYFMSTPLLGFDIEWLQNAYRSASPKHNVSLIQIASEERVALFHIALYAGSTISELVAPSLKKVLEDPNVTKVGVSIKSDCTRLRNNLDIHPRGLFELSHLYKLIKFSSSKEPKLINKKLVSLATQVREHLHLPLYKGDIVRSSDWSRPLNMEQIKYAASDSYAGVQLFDTMEVKRKELDPTPPRPWHAELNRPIRVAEGVEIATDDEGVEEEEEDVKVEVEKKVRRKRATPYVKKAEKVQDGQTAEGESSEVAYPVLPTSQE